MICSRAAGTEHRALKTTADANRTRQAYGMPRAAELCYPRLMRLQPLPHSRPLITDHLPQFDTRAETGVGMSVDAAFVLCDDLCLVLCFETGDECSVHPHSFVSFESDADPKRWLPCLVLEWNGFVSKMVTWTTVRQSV